MASLQLSVQELAKDFKILIPDLYVREPQESTFVSKGSSPALPSMPVIDIKDLIKMQGSESHTERSKILRSVCQEWGGFQVVNHGVDKLLVEKMKKDVADFFNMPVEEKERYQKKEGEYEGFGQTIMDPQGRKVDWGDRVYMTTNPLHRRKPELLPQFPPILRDTIEHYLQEVQKLGTTLMCLIAEAVDIDKKEILDVLEDGLQRLKLTYYPPCPQPDLVFGITPHSDGSGITILMEVNDVEGLQVNKDGVWIPVNFLPDAFVVIIGDALKIMSNDVCHSIEHKVTVNETKERISVALFFNPKLEADIGPAKSLLMNTGNKPIYRTISMEEYINVITPAKINGKRFLETMKIGDEDHES